MNTILTDDGLLPYPVELLMNEDASDEVSIAFAEY